MLFTQLYVMIVIFLVYGITNGATCNNLIHYIPMTRISYVDESGDSHIIRQTFMNYNKGRLEDI